MGLLDETIGRIHPLDREAMYKAQKRWDDLYVGVGDLGKLEEMVIQYAGVTGEVLPEIPKCCMVVACADHGVYRQKVSAYPQSTTVGMVKSYVDVKGASANALAHYCGVFTVGEMGIANTTASACILGAFNRWNAVEVTGRGTNISDARLLHKIEMVQKALDVNQPDPADGLDVLSKVGGFEFGCMTGVMLGAAANRCLTIIDGFNSTASAFIAKALSEESVQYLMASHLSLEQAHRKSLKAIGLTEYIDLDIRLGEAVGASIQKKILDMALAVYKDGADKRTGVAE